MSGLAPIPPRLRTDTIEVEVIAEGEYGGVYAPPVTISAVRFDSAQTLVKSNVVLTDGAKGLLYIDATSPGAFEIPAGSRVTVRGMRRGVGRVERFEGFDGKVHHWEVEVL